MLSLADQRLKFIRALALDCAAVVHTNGWIQSIPPFCVRCLVLYASFSPCSSCGSKYCAVVYVKIVYACRVLGTAIMLLFNNRAACCRIRYSSAACYLLLFLLSVMSIVCSSVCSKTCAFKCGTLRLATDAVQCIFLFKSVLRAVHSCTTPILDRY